MRLKTTLALSLCVLSACSTHVVVGEIQGIQAARIEGGPDVYLRKIDGQDLSNFWSRWWRGDAKSADVAPGKRIVNAYWATYGYSSSSFTRRKDYEVTALPGHTYRLSADTAWGTNIHVDDVTNSR